MVALLLAVGCGQSDQSLASGNGGSEPPVVSSPNHASIAPEAITVEGKLVFPRRVELTFGVGGTVGEILASPGQRVESGDILATLDDRTVTALSELSAQHKLVLYNNMERLEDLRRDYEHQQARVKQAVNQATIALDSAQERLENFPLDYNTKLARANQANAAAEMALDQSMERLEDFQAEHPQRLAAAAETRAAAELALGRTLDSLASAGFNHAQTLAAALQAVTAAELARDRAQEDLDDFQREHLRQVARARITAADAALAQKVSLDQLAAHAPAHAQDLANALMAKTVAEQALKDAESNLEEFEKDTAGQLALAVRDLDTTTKDLEDANDALSAFTLRSVGFPLPRDQETARLTELQRDIKEATDLQVIAQATVAALSITTSGRPCLDVGPSLLMHRCRQLQAEITAAEARLVNAKNELGVLQGQASDTTSAKSRSYLERQQLEAAVQLTQTALDQAREDLAELERGPDSIRQGLLDSALEVANTKVDSALKRLEDVKTNIQWLSDYGPSETLALVQSELAASQEALAAAEKGSNPGEIAAARERVVAARIAYTAATESQQARDAGAEPLEIAALEAQIRLLSESLITADRELSRLSAGPDPLVLAALEAAVATARSEYSQAQSQLASLETSQDRLELSLRQQQVEVARQDLVKAEKDLAELEPGPDPLEIALLEAQISKGTAAVAATLEDLEGARVRAEFPGVVARVNLDADTLVTDKSRIISLVDPASVEVHGFVDGSKVQSIREGDLVTVAIQSLNGVPLTGTVHRISASPRTDRGVLTFPIVVRVEMPPGVEVPLELSGVSFSIPAGP